MFFRFYYTTNLGVNMITSKDNHIVKLAKLLKIKKYCRIHNKCLVESVKIVSELYSRGLVDTIILAKSRENLSERFKDTHIEIVSQSIADYLSDTVTTDGVFAICQIPSPRSQHDFHRCIILDRIQDPSNYGAIIRSACAFGYTTILSIDSVYPYTTKCIRSSMGYVFDVDLIDCDYAMLQDIREKHNVKIITADMSGDTAHSVNIGGNVGIVIGNEGRGISEDIRAISDMTISIPMLNNVESLNASVSASILMYLYR